MLCLHEIQIQNQWIPSGGRGLLSLDDFNQSVKATTEQWWEKGPFESGGKSHTCRTFGDGKSLCHDLLQQSPSTEFTNLNGGSKPQVSESGIFLKNPRVRKWRSSEISFKPEFNSSPSECLWFNIYMISTTALIVMTCCNSHHPLNFQIWDIGIQRLTV